MKNLLFLVIKTCSLDLFNNALALSLLMAVHFSYLIVVDSRFWQLDIGEPNKKLDKKMQNYLQLFLVLDLSYKIRYLAK